MNWTRSVQRAILAGCVVGTSGSPAMAGVVVIVEEIGNDVVISGGGTLDTSLWTYLNTVPQSPGLQANLAVVLGPVPLTNDIYGAPINFTGPAMIGPGTATFFADGGNGDPFGLFWLPDPAHTAMFVPAGYVSGELLTGTMSTFLDHSFSSLGLTEGTYTWTWDTADGQGDFFSINVVPAPSMFALLGIAGLVPGRRRQPQAAR